MNLNNLPPEFYDSIKIAGQDKHNSEIDKLKQQSIENKQHKEKINEIKNLNIKIESISNDISEHKKSQIISEKKQQSFNWITFFISSLLALSSLIISIIALSR